MQPFAEQNDVFGRIIGITEVREEEPRWLALQDGGEGSVPDAEIDVRRRSSGHDEGISLDAHARRIADEGNAFRLVEVADVVRGVPGRVDDLELAQAESEIFSSLEDAQIFRRNGKSFAEQELQIVGPETLGAGEEFGRVDHVRRAILLYIDGKPWIFADEGACSAGVVQVDVRQKNGVEIAHADATGMKPLVQGAERGTWPWVDDGAVAV